MKTLAIVIGNNNYYENAKLDNAINDAKGIANVFERLGYDIIYKEDCTINDYIELLTQFEAIIKDYDATIFYFAGHGFQLDGENYLTSIDCQVANPNKYHCSKTCITLTEILEIIKINSNKINIIIIDACRKSFERGGYNTFTPVQAPKGSLIAFSTSANEGAKDYGTDGHSVYTGALLNYIGREWISVEELFKKVRKTVYNLTEGEQTTWEHTSLIGDFYFNTGQLVHSIQIPYDEIVVKDGDYINEDDFSELIFELKSSNWHRQNPAIEKLLKIVPKDLNKNQQFIFGRNLMQTNGYANNSTNFFENLTNNLIPYIIEEENHLLNGILFEIYFNKQGEFRRENYKNYDFEKIFALRKNPRFNKSFEFLQNVLKPYQEFLYYIPSEKNSIIDIDVVATSEKSKDPFRNDTLFQIISRVNVFNKDITKQMTRYGIHGQNSFGLKEVLSNFLLAPKELININCNTELTRIGFIEFKETTSVF
ncbi:caspase family protein [Flavobacterium psychrophilum]|nr:caspase family protein [Flavobacterium psychrophilum]